MVSIRAPARGATFCPRSHLWSAPFQFALPRGERRLVHGNRPAGAAVSIRAPARGATQSRCGIVLHGRCFNSRSREGSDFARVEISQYGEVSIRAPARGATHTHKRHFPAKLFQFALPRGERLQSWWCALSRRSFNSRSREGSDGQSPHPRRGRPRFNSRSREGSDAHIKRER